MRPDRIEVAQQRENPQGRIGMAGVGQDLLAHPLRSGVRIGWMSRLFLGQRDDSGVAMDGTRGREDPPC